MTDDSEQRGADLSGRARDATSRARQAYRDLAGTADRLADTYDNLAKVRAARHDADEGDAKPVDVRRAREKAEGERHDADHLRRTAERTPSRRTRDEPHQGS